MSVFDNQCDVNQHMIPTGLFYDICREEIVQCRSFNEVQQTVSQMALEKLINGLNAAYNAEYVSTSDFMWNCSRMEMALVIIIVETLRPQTSNEDLSQTLCHVPDDTKAVVTQYVKYIKTKFIIHQYHRNTTSTFWTALGYCWNVRTLIMYLANICLTQFAEVCHFRCF